VPPINLYKHLEKGRKRIHLAHGVLVVGHPHPAVVALEGRHPPGAAQLKLAIGIVGNRAGLAFRRHETLQAVAAQRVELVSRSAVGDVLARCRRRNRGQEQQSEG
jgi:hypothetical protein